jgi:hypothetical protein
MRKSRFSVEQITYALKQVEMHVPVAEVWAVNHKRVYELYRQENLAVRTKKRKKACSCPTVKGGIATSCACAPAHAMARRGTSERPRFRNRLLARSSDRRYVKRGVTGLRVCRQRATCRRPGRYPPVRALEARVTAASNRPTLGGRSARTPRRSARPPGRSERP